MAVWKRALPVVVVVAVMGVGAGLVRALVMNAPPADDRQPQQVTLLKPPPPPKVDEPPPPPPEVKEEVEIPEPEALPEDLPEQAQDAPPPGEALGLDADGGAGSDGFGLAARRGGRGLLEGGGDAQAWFEGELSRRLTEALNRVLRDADAARAARNRFTVRVRVGSDGAVEEAALLESTGDAQLDQALEQAMADVNLGRALPDQVRRALRLRVSTARL